MNLIVERKVETSKNSRVVVYHVSDSQESKLSKQIHSRYGFSVELYRK